MKNIERGFRRIAAVLSVTFGLLFLGLELAPPHPALFRDPSEGILVALGFGLPWIVFYVIRWIVRGFLN